MSERDEDMTPEEFDVAFAAGEPVEIVVGPQMRVLVCDLGPFRLTQTGTWSSGGSGLTLTYSPTRPTR